MTMTTYQRLRLEGYLFLVAFGLCIPAANWMIGHVGTTCVPNGPCLVPVAPGLAAPSGVLMIGLALVLRDLVQRRLGPGWTALAIVFGALLSALVAPRALVFASAVAFLLSEFADMAVYTPLQKKRLVLAVLLSGLIGLTIDSIVFLYMAFGNLDFLAGQIVGKAWITVLSLPFIHWIRNRDDKINP
jgi:queuosine precursor transporter